MPTLIINGGASILTGNGGSGSGAITIKEDGTIVVSSATSLNFTGDVTLADDGSGEVTISVAGGSQGPQGPQGVSGSAGSQGPQGYQGSDGAQGPQGYQGSDGAQGPQGFQGSSGSSALQGAYDGGSTITTASSTPITYNLSSGGFTVNGGGAVDIGYAGTDVSTFNVGATTVNIESPSGRIANGTGAFGTGVLNWATSPSASVILGNYGASTSISSSGATVILYNNGGFSINTQGGSGSIDINGTGTGNILIGVGVGSSSISIGTSTGSSRAISIGNGTGASPVTISSGTGGISIGTNAVARSINIGTGAAVQTVTLGSSSSTSSTTIQAGTGGVSISGTTFTVSGGATISIGATAAARTVNLGTGAAAQTVNVGSTNTTSTTTISAGTGGITLSAPTTTVTGDLVVQGTTTSLSSETVLISDNFLYLNQGYATATAVPGGIIVNYEPTSTSDTVATGGFTAGVASTSNPTVATTGAATFSLGDIIQINGTSDPDNNGLFEVLSHSSNVLTIRGIGTTSTVETFTQDQFDTSTVVAGTITKVKIAVLRVNTSGSWESAYGSSTPLTFSALGGGAAQDYDLAGEAAGTPVASSNVYNFVSGRAWTLKASGHKAACISNPTGNTIFTIKKNGSSIGTVTFTNDNLSGTVEITSAPTDVSFDVNDVFSITAPVSLNSIDTPYWTFLGTRP